MNTENLSPTKHNSRSSTVKWLYSVPGRKKLYILALIIVQAVNGASGVLYALLLRCIVDNAATHNTNEFWRFTVLTVLLVIAQVALRAVIRWLNELSRAVFENTFKSRLMGNILRKDFARVSAVHSGEWLNRLTNDSVVVAESYVEILPGLVGMVVKLVSAFTMMLLLDWRFACILLPCGVVMLLFTYGLRRKLKGLHKQVQEKDGSLRVFMQESIGSMLMLRSFAAGEQTSRHADELMDSHKSIRMKRTAFSNICNTGFGLAMNGMYIFGVCYCGFGILMGTISYGTLTAVTQLISQIQMPFASISGYLPKFYAMTASAERLMEIEVFPDDCDNDALDIGAVRDFYTGSMLSFGLKNARFAYYPPSGSIMDISKEGMPDVLDNVTVVIEKGQYVAFTGHSGCGKSTVLKLLMSIYQLDGGERFLSGNSGTVPLDARWHRLFAYVPQGNQLMSGTIREIVAFADKDDMDNVKRIDQALKIACAYDFVYALDEGIDTLLGERGTGLSEGQMQRIAIARAIFSGNPVLLLDEATSALDEQTEKQVLRNLRSMTDKTVVIVTHRPAALEICDKIVDFNN